MPFKQNLPAVILLASLAGLGALFLLLQPTDEDRLRRAVAAHVKAVPKAQSVEILGPVAAIRTADGRLLFHAFARTDAVEWRFDRDLQEDFTRHLRDPAVVREIGTRLGTRLSDRYKTDIGVHEGIEYQAVLLPEPDGLVGQVSLAFAYKKEGDGPPPRGRYVERFRWENGAWTSLGAGSLYDAAPAR